MVFHPPSIVVEIVVNEVNDQGRSCEEHPINCGKVVLEPDVVVAHHSTASNPVCNLQGGNHHEGL